MQLAQYMYLNMYCAVETHASQNGSTLFATVKAFAVNHGVS